jgi:hypothetical protein
MNKKLVLLAVAGVGVAGYVFRNEIRTKVQEAMEGLSETDIVQSALLARLNENGNINLLIDDPDPGER